MISLNDAHPTDSARWVHHYTSTSYEGGETVETDVTDLHPQLRERIPPILSPPKGGHLRLPLAAIDGGDHCYCTSWLLHSCNLISQHW